MNAAYRKLDPELAQARAGGREAPQTSAARSTADDQGASAGGACPSRATTHVLVRGDFLQPGEEVAPGTPAVLPPLQPRGQRPDRLDLARWLVDPANPLTAAGGGQSHLAARTSAAAWSPTRDDFGTQGEQPSHPELLDWLAGEFVPARLEPEATAPADRHVGDVSAVVRTRAGAAGPRPEQHAARRGRAASASRPRSSATWRWRPAAC